jgi:hypothetical protein
MTERKRKLPEWPSAEDAGAWGTYEPYLADLELYLGGLNYPVNRDALVEHVRSQDAPEVITVSLQQLPEQEFTSAADISMALEEIQ